MSYHAEWSGVHVRLAPSTRERLYALLREEGKTLSDWVTAQVNQAAAARVPESHGGVRKLVPHEAALLAHKLLVREAQLMENEARRLPRLQRLDRMRTEVGPLLDAGAWFADTLEEIDRRERLSEEGRVPTRKSDPDPKSIVERGGVGLSVDANARRAISRHMPTFAESTHP